MLLGEGHDVAIVGVGHVELELRELRIVLEGDAFVPEVPPNLVDAFDPADEQALEVELKRDAQVEILMELVMMGHEGPGRGAAIDRLQDRRLDLDEIHVRRERLAAKPECGRG